MHSRDGTTLHPLVNVLDFSQSKRRQNSTGTPADEASAVNFGFYSVFLKEDKHCDIRYGTKLVEVAKEELFTRSKLVNEVAYELGFKYPQQFTRFFTANRPMTIGC